MHSFVSVSHGKDLVKVSYSPNDIGQTNKNAKGKDNEPLESDLGAFKPQTGGGAHGICPYKPKASHYEQKVSDT
jgi:hypothetical protein